MNPYLILFLLLFASQGIAQDSDRKIQFPDTKEYKTLKCDFHIHSTFSDGSVWPDIRVEEAIRDGLDAIALTEHLEYQPHLDDIPHPDRNRSYEIAKEVAKPHGLLVIHATEITRDMPPGHANAIFIEDANKIKTDSYYDAYKEARSQGAFIFWNHPNWVNQQDDGIPVMSDEHKQLLADDLLHGIEVVNDITYSEHALLLAQEYGLTVIGTSDIHGLVDWQFMIPEGGHRPINLVFAKEKTEASIKEALFAGRTVAWYNNLLVGDPENIDALMEVSLTVESNGMIGPSSILEIDFTNHSDAKFVLNNTSAYDFYQDGDLVQIEPHSTKRISVLTAKVDTEQVVLTFDALNVIRGYKQSTKLEYSFSKN